MCRVENEGLQGLRILIAEDDKLSATLLKAMLETEGHSVCAVEESGEAAIAAAAALRPDAVLMDIYLLGSMTGVEAARQIVSKLGIPALIITGTTDKEILEQVVECGALGFIKKPVSADELRVNVRILLHYNALEKRLKESEVRYLSLVENTPLGICFCSAEGFPATCNTRFAEILGYSSPEECLAASETFCSLQVRNGLFSELEKTKTISGKSLVLSTKEGRSLAVNAYFSSLKMPSGRLLGYQVSILPE